MISTWERYSRRRKKRATNGKKSRNKRKTATRSKRYNHSRGGGGVDAGWGPLRSPFRYYILKDSHYATYPTHTHRLWRGRPEFRRTAREQTCLYQTTLYYLANPGGSSQIPTRLYLPTCCITSLPVYKLFEIREYHD